MSIRLLFILLLFASCSSNQPKEQVTEPTSKSKTAVTAQPSDTIVTQENETASGPLVYTTKEGNKYHTADCRYSKDAHSVSLKQAKVDGKTACDLCKPNSVTGDKQIRCSAKTTDGTRCKRMTTNTSGKCFQHNRS